MNHLEIIVHTLRQFHITVPVSSNVLPPYRQVCVYTQVS